MSRFKLCLGVLFLVCLALALLPSKVAADAQTCSYFNNARVVYDWDNNVAWCESSSNAGCGQCIFSSWPAGYTVCNQDTYGYLICICYQY
ncbi:MAG TPA: hypothetical protein VHQ90_25045 [Thermoanaerobaculia bacterium]|nr:hypothetical protein [Thermoanaerobaculia bacterium]